MRMANIFERWAKARKSRRRRTEELKSKEEADALAQERRDAEALERRLAFESKHLAGAVAAADAFVVPLSRLYSEISRLRRMSWVSLSFGVVITAGAIYLAYSTYGSVSERFGADARVRERADAAAASWQACTTASRYSSLIDPCFVENVYMKTLGLI